MKRTLSLLTIMCMSPLAWCCSCATLSLQQQYDLADDIVVGKITNCQIAESPDYAFRTVRECAIETLEVLKGNTVYQIVSDNYSSCRYSPEVNETYLMFLGANGWIGYCSGSGRLGPVKEVTARDRYLAKKDGREDELFRFDQAARNHGRLTVLREFKQGVRDDLPEPWTYSDTGYSCQLGHRVLDDAGMAFLSFEYIYTGELPDWMPTPQSLEPSGVSSRTLQSGHLSVRVSVQRQSNLAEEQAEAGIGNSRFLLEPHFHLFEIDGLKIETKWYVQDGSTAQNMLAALSGATKEVVVLVPLDNKSPRIVPEPVPLPASAEYRSTTSLLSDSVEKFKTCMQQGRNN